MTIQEQIKNDIKNALRNKDKVTLSNLKFILGEFSRLKGVKDGKTYIGSNLSDDISCKVLKAIMLNEEKLAKITKTKVSPLYYLAKSYLPKEMSKQEILDYINTIDFSKLNNKMQVIGIIKKEFGVKVDANMVRDIVENYEV